MPGGLAPDVVWYLRLVVGFAFPGTPEEFPVEYLFSVSTDARTLNRSLTFYERAVFSLVGSTSDELKTLVNYLAAFATETVEPETPASLRESISAADNSMREAVRAARATVTLTQLAEAALAVRRGKRRSSLRRAFGFRSRSRA